MTGAAVVIGMESETNQETVKPQARIVARMGVCVLYRVRIEASLLPRMRIGLYEPVVWFLRDDQPEPDETGTDWVWIDTDTPERFGWERAEPAEPEVPAGA